MLDDYVTIGSSPYGEDGIQVGSDDYYQKSRKELIVYKEQLIRQLGDPPFGCVIKIKSFPHDFGSYNELVAEFDSSNEEATDFAFKLEEKGPEFWDETSIERLKELGLRK